MSDSGRKKPPLVADRRYAAGSKPKPKAKSKSTPKPKPKSKPTSRKTASKAKTSRARGKVKRAPKSRNILVRLVLGLLGWIFRLVWGFSWRIGAITAVIVAGAIGLVYTTLPEASTLLDGRAQGSVTLTDRNGEVFAWRGDQFGGVVTAGSVSPHLKNAVVATEDKRFYTHLGISPRGVASAVRINLREGRGPLSGHGGSTITQQTAKLLCLGVAFDDSLWESEAAYEADCRRGSMWRKIKEAIYALALESKYTKDEILSIYLNRAYMGGGAYGAEAAAQRGAAEKFELLLTLIDVILARLARTGASGTPPMPEAALGEAEILSRLSPDPQAARRWADLAGEVTARVRHGQAVNLDPAALVLDTVFKMQKTASQ